MFTGPSGMGNYIARGLDSVECASWGLRAHEMIYNDMTQDSTLVCTVWPTEVTRCNIRLKGHAGNFEDSEVTVQDSPCSSTHNSLESLPLNYVEHYGYLADRGRYRNLIIII